MKKSNATTRRGLCCALLLIAASGSTSATIAANTITTGGPGSAPGARGSNDAGDNCGARGTQSPLSAGPRFSARREHPLPAKPEGLLATDLDGDGTSELFAVTQDPGVMHSLSGTGAGRSWNLGTYPLAPRRVETPTSALAAIAVASRGDRTLRIIAPLGNDAQENRGPSEGELYRLELDQTPRALTTTAGRLALACDGRELLLIDEKRAITKRKLAADLPRCALLLTSGEGVVVGFQDTRRLHYYPFDATPGSAAHDSAWSADLNGIPRDLLEVDLDGDGDLELACSAGDRSLWVFGWNAAGGGVASFAAAQPLEWRTQAIPYSLSSFPSPATPNSEPPANHAAWRLLIAHASDLAYLELGAFSAAGPLLRHSAYAGQTPRDCAVGDFDGDSLPDLAIANRDSLAVSIMLGSPALPEHQRPTFAAGPRTPVGGFPNSIAAGDLDGDGLPEVMTLNSKDDSLSVLPNRSAALTTGSGRQSALGQAITLPCGPSPRSLASADINADGRGDAALISVDGASSRVRLFLGRGPGNSLRLEPASVDLALGIGGTDLLILDLDRDGDQDLLAADPIGNLLVWWTQGPAGEFTEAGRLELPGGPRAIAALGPRRGAGSNRNTGFDENTPLLAVALSGPGEPRGVALVEVRPRGERGEEGLEIVPSAHIPIDGSPQDIEAADLNGDGFPDLALLARDGVGSPRGNIRLLLATADGQFEARPPRPTSMEPRTLVLADPNRDGALDLFVTAQFSHVINVWTVEVDGDRSPSGLIARPHLGAGVGCLDLAPADINGDGRPDLVVANAHTDDVSVLLAK